MCNSIHVIGVSQTMATTKVTRPQEFWRDHVMPNYDEYRRHPNSIRHAMNAALSAFHMADWVWTTYHEDDPQKVADTARPLAYSLYLADNGYPDFRVIKDIAEAHKHLKLTVRTDDRVVLSAGSHGIGTHWSHHPAGAYRNNNGGLAEASN